MVIFELFVGAEVVKMQLLHIEPLPIVRRGEWMRPSHVALRNAAWWVRNSRISGQEQNRMIAILTIEFSRLYQAGEPFESLVPSLVDLFDKP